MKKHFLKAFVPHEHNEHKPHIFRPLGLLVVGLFIIGFFMFARLQVYILTQSEYFLSAVLPSVLVDLANDDREDEGFPALSISPVLEEAAQLKANDMAEKGYFAHTSPEGLAPWYWLDEAGYRYFAAGENLAVNFSDSKNVEEAWMDSPSHRANILSNNFTEIGIATARGEYKGRETVFVVQMFGRPVSTVFEAPLEDLFATRSDVSAEDEQVVVENEDVLGAEADIQSPSERLAQSFVAHTVEDNTVYPSDADVAQGSQDATSTEVVAVAVDQEEASTNTRNADNESTIVERFVSQPLTILQLVYIFIAFLVLMSVVLMTAFEAARSHARHALYGVFILLILFVFFYLFKPFFFPEVLVAAML